MKKILDYVLSTLYLIHFGLTLLVFHVIQVIAFNVFGKKAHKTAVDWLNFSLTFGLYLTGASIKLKNLAQLPDNRPIIFVANHQSSYDISPVYWYMRKYSPRFVSKIELAKGVPSISYNLRKSGAALINRKDGKQAITEIARLGKLLGPKGLMPNPKLGTVTPNVEQAVKDAKSGQIEFRVEKAGIIHAGIGKLSFSDEQLKANFDAFVDAIVKAKPSGSKGKYVRKVALTSTMGPGLKIDTVDVAGA